MEIMNVCVRFFAVVLISIGLAACVTNASDTNDEPLKDIQLSVFNHTWYVNTIEGKPAKKGAKGFPASLILDAENNRASGFTGCNNYFSVFTHEQNEISFGALAMTKKHCGRHTELESRFSKALRKVSQLKYSGDELILLSTDNHVLLTLSKAM